MNEVSKTECAPYDKQQDWNAINWREIRKHVRRLQNRIAKAIRRHSNKSSHWIWNKYFTNGTIDATFSIQVQTNKKGVATIVQLYRPAYTPIRRHIKVVSTANPYDPAFDAYFQKRSQWRIALALECHQPTIFTISRKKR